jgi:hypothetical protein
LIENELRKPNISFVGNTVYSRALFQQGGLFPPELDCVTSYGPWPAVIASIGTCASTYSNKLIPLDPAFGQVEWTGDILNPPGEYDLVQGLSEQPAGQSCVPCGGGSCNLRSPNPNGPPIF